MRTQSTRSRATRTALFVWFASIALAVCGFDSQAQDLIRARDKDDRGDNPNRLRSSIELAGYTRPGTPPDIVNDDGKIIAAAFEGKDMKKFKVLGATIYFCVFKNTGAEDGDTFGTGMADFDRRFDAGRSFTEAYSPRFDKKARYLYLYQIVNDRFLNPQITPVKGAKEGEVKNPLFDPNVKNELTTSIPSTEPIQQFALKLLVDPRFLTSWGHFRDSGFAASVVDVDNAGKPVKQVVDDGKNKVERDREIRLAFSYLPAITTKLPYPAYKELAKPISLGDLENGFGVANSGLNLTDSKAYRDLKLVAGQIGKDNVKWAAFVDRLIKTADHGRDPDFVQINYPKIDWNDPQDPGIPGPGYRHFPDEVAYSVFRVTWLPGKSLKQGERSVIVGFTTDLPPVFAPVRADNDKSADAGKELQLSGGPNVDVENKRPAAGAGAKQHFTAFYGNNVEAEAEEMYFTQAGGGDGSGSAFGTVPTPSPPPPPAAGGGGGAPLAGGLGGQGGGSGGGGGGFGMPGWGGFPMRGIGGFGGGGGFAGGGFGGGTGGGTGSGNGNGNATPSQQQSGNSTQQGQQIINFKATLTNQQLQQQQQFQIQEQNQHQSQQNRNNNEHGHGHHGHGHHGHGHVVPAPASLLLGLLGLPGLLLLRRRKNMEANGMAMSDDAS